jgi:hypothetical protein
MPSPALGQCADLGLELLWVLADGSCYYHAILHAEREQAGTSTNHNDPSYQSALQALREEAARQLTATDVRGDPGRQRQVALRKAARASRASGVIISEAEAIATLTELDWESYHREVASGSLWPDGEVVGTIMAAKLQRTIAMLHWLVPSAEVPTGRLQGTICIFNQDTGTVEVVVRGGEGQQPIDMDDPVLAENSDNPEQQAILVWFNNINHYWAIRRSPRPACELRVALGTELLWAKPADWPRFRLNPPSPDVADSAEQTPKRTPPGGGSLLPVPTRKSKRGRVAKRHSSTLETAKGQRSSMLRDFVTEHSLHERPVHEWPRAHE